jgi:hypothetical protein
MSSIIAYPIHIFEVLSALHNTEKTKSKYDPASAQCALSAPFECINSGRFVIGKLRRKLEHRRMASQPLTPGWQYDVAGNLH